LHETAHDRELENALLRKKRGRSPCWHSDLRTYHALSEALGILSI
jgi:hypothetical protein